MNHLETVTDKFFNLLGIIREIYFKPAEQIARSRLSPAQFFALSLLCQKGNLPMSALAANMKISKQQLTPLIAKLLDNGLVERKPDPHDRRIWMIVLTDLGKDTYLALLGQIKSNFREKLRELPAAEIGELEDTITKLESILISTR